jgi:hypothetical protein
LHDLVRAFAGELGAAQLPASEREEARGRLEDHFVHTMHSGVPWFRPGYADVEVPARRTGSVVLDFESLPAAQAWFRDEHDRRRRHPDLCQHLLETGAARGAVGTA